jgi:hypothetical protein
VHRYYSLFGLLHDTKDVGVLSDLLGKRPTAGYPYDAKSLVLQRFDWIRMMSFLSGRPAIACMALTARLTKTC